MQDSVVAFVVTNGTLVFGGAKTNDLHSHGIYHEVFFVFVKKQAVAFTFPELKGFESKYQIILLFLRQIQNKHTVSIDKYSFKPNYNFLNILSIVSQYADITIFNVQFIFQFY